MRNQIAEGERLLKQYRERLDELRDVDYCDPEKVALRTAWFSLACTVQSRRAFEEMYPEIYSKEDRN